MAQMSGGNMKFYQGTFVGNDTYAYDVACPFKPDVYIVWTDEVTNNPGKKGLLSIAEIRAKLMMSMRYSSGTSENPSSGWSADSSGDYYRSVYANGVMTIIAGLNRAYQFYDGITYKFIFAKELDD